MLDRRRFLKAVLGTAVGGMAAGRTPVRRPNVVLIMIDDLSWMDLHCQGNERLTTPNIDRLAGEGIRFTDAYAAAPVCSPTRASIMSGQSPARLKITNHIPDRASFAPKDAQWKSAKALDFLSPDCVTIAERLRKAGYATVFLGKWHLSGRAGRGGLGVREYEPDYQGYDVNIGGCAYGGPPTYFDPYGIHNIASRKEGEYLPYRLADEAIDFIGRSGDKPFFITLWNYTVHWPMEAPADLVKKYENRLGPGLKDARYGAMIEAMDDAVGRLTAALEKAGKAGDTLVIFTSDNGGFDGVSDNRPLRESKGHLYEGGIRVPMIMRWPGVINAGVVCDTPVISTDLYPTLLDVAGLEPTSGQVLDGESLAPILTGQGGLKRDALYWHYPNYAWHGANRLGSAIRQGDYKLLKWCGDDEVELYNLRKDLSETTNLAARMPDLAARMKARLLAWLEDTDAEMPERL